MGPSGPNQRATVRYRCPPATAGRVQLADDVKFLRAWLQNLSAAGIGLLMSKPLDCGLLVTVQIKSQVSKKTYALSAHVIHATQQSKGEWLIGCAFEEPLTSENLDDLL
jgi:hypothetical protein